MHHFFLRQHTISRIKFSMISRATRTLTTTIMTIWKASVSSSSLDSVIPTIQEYKHFIPQTVSIGRLCFENNPFHFEQWAKNQNAQKPSLLHSKLCSHNQDVIYYAHEWTVLLELSDCSKEYFSFSERIWPAEQKLD